MLPHVFFQSQSIGKKYEIKTRNTPFEVIYNGRHPHGGFSFHLYNGRRIRIRNLRRVLREIR